MIRTFLFQPFNIPSGSMKATLLGRRLSVRVEILLRLQPVFVAAVAADFLRSHSRRLHARARRCGGVRLPKDTSTDYIKRVIGLRATRSR
ncbi:MAG: S26 family signal peptidase [Pseudolabrys sp.]